MQDTARRIAKLKLDAKLAIDEDDYVASFCPALMKVTYEWCKGAKFSEIMKLTEMCAKTSLQIYTMLFPGRVLFV